VVSINDQYGGLIELVRRALLFRVCRVNGIEDVQSGQCLQLAARLYRDDFRRLNSSRTFEAWWKDTLVNPFYLPEYLWSFPAILSILREEGCEFYSSSPVWATFQHHAWYKNLTAPAERHEQVLRDWRSNLAYFLTGIKAQRGPQEPAEEEVVRAVAAVTAALGDAARDAASADNPPTYPVELDRYLAANADARVRTVNDELKRLFGALRDPGEDAVLDAYARAAAVRSVWGTAYHYLCFQRGYAAPTRAVA
jgi:hypothetical protein